MEQLKVIISGGGTGGHIFPAVAIANAIKNRFPDADILFVGADNRMEMQRVPAAGYKIVGLPIAGFDRKRLWKNIAVLWKLQRSLFLAKNIIRKFKPDIAIGVGGYASGPTLKVAAQKGVPTLIQEQNSYAGVTNKLLAQSATCICVAYEGMEKFFPKEKIVITGNPCRQDLSHTDLNRAEALEYFKLDANKKVLLIIGGSLGSRTINQSILGKLDMLDPNIQIIWQTGEFYFHDLYLAIPSRVKSGNIHLYDFIDRMDLAYLLADLVISRAGAGSISELSLLAKPVILIPSPNVAEDHQTKNAMALVNKDAALMLTDAEALEQLIPLAMATIKDKVRLSVLSENIAKMAHHDSANRIVDEVVKVIAKKKKK